MKLYIICSVVWNVNYIVAETFTESLTVRRLSNALIAADFRFEFFRNASECVGANDETLGNVNVCTNFDLWPKFLFELVERYALDELHLSLTQGMWRMNLWGYPPEGSGPTGAQIWSWFKLPKQEQSGVDERWKDVVHSLSGMFCASFSQMHPYQTVVPDFGFLPEGRVSSSADQSPKPARYAALSSENVCTENFTPWKKLLPCKAQTGLSALLNPIQLYSARYHSLSLHVRHVCPESSKSCRNPGLELIQTISVVLPNAYDFYNLFGSKVQRPCAVAEESKIYIETNAESSSNFSPNYTKIVKRRSGGEYALYDLKEINFTTPLNVRLSGLGHVVPPTYCAGIQIHSYIAGVGQQDGTLVSQLNNLHPTQGITVVYAHVIPWFLQVYFHTMTIICNEDQKLEPRFTHFAPGFTRQRPHYMELNFEIPPASKCRLSLDFDRMLLRWTEYPPDAHHGFHVPAPSATFELKGENCSRVFDWGDHEPSSRDHPHRVRLYGEAMLVRLPTPDFSMPYNVICLVCTVVALAFGPIHNLTTRSLVVKDPEEVRKKGLRAKVHTFVAKIRGLRKGNQQLDRAEESTSGPDRSTREKTD